MKKKLNKSGIPISPNDWTEADWLVLHEGIETVRAKIAKMHGSEKIVHMCLDIRGALKDWRPEEWVGVVKDDSGRVMTPDEVKVALEDQITRGVRAIPIGGPCEGFDPSGGGCPGHEKH